MYRFLKRKYREKRAKGFTLVETLVAVTIFVLVILGPMTIASRGLQNAYFVSAVRAIFRINADACVKTGDAR